MRISSINVALPKNYNYQTKVRETQARNINIEQPSFKGVKAGLLATAGGIIGAAVGTVLTGGVLVPFMLAGAGTIIGGEYGIKDEPHSDEYGVPYNDGPSSFDYIG
jgi:hypothetical protein